MRLNKALLVISAVLMVAMVSPQLQAGESDSMQKRFAVDPGKTVSIEFKDVDGDVIVETHDKDEVLFKFVKEMKGSKSRRNMEYFEGIQPEIEHEGNTLEIKVKYPKRSFSFFRSLSGFRVKVKSTLLVPENTEIEVRLVDGDVKVSGLKGDVQLKSVDGDLEVKGCEGDLKLRTVDGEIDAKDCSGTVDTYTTDGNVNVSGVFSGVHFRSVDGDAAFKLKEGSKLAEDCDFRTVDGDIDLAFPGDFGFKVYVRTTDGSIKVRDLGFDNINLQKRNRLEAERKDASHLIKIKSTDGDVSLGKL